MRKLVLALFSVALLLPAQRVPKTKNEVARPGGDLPGNPKIALVKVADGFYDPTNVASAFDGTGRMFVTERVGRVRLVHNDGTVQREPFLDLTNINPLGNDVQTGFVEQGLYSIAFHPDYENNGYFFVHYASLPFNGDGVIVRFQVDPESPNVMSKERTNETAKVIMRIPQPYYNHNGGELTFGPDGYLYIASGDGGWEGDPYEAGQDLGTLLGKMIRIDVDVDDDSIPYQIPKDNPFAQASKEQLMVLFGITEEQFGTIKTRSLPEIWSYGLRNPYEFSFDLESGDMYIADVGQNHWEEIDFQPASSKGGENYGWNRLMGTHCFPMTGPDDECGLIGALPAAEYPHEIPYPGADPIDDGWGCSIEGLGVANYGDMQGVYLVGDWCSGRVFGLGWDSRNDKWQLEELLHANLQFTAGGYDEDGYVLAVNCYCFYTSDQGPEANPAGALWRVVPADEVPEGAEVARTISGGGASLMPEGGPVTFLHPLDNTVIRMDMMPEDEPTAQVEEFIATAENPYSGQQPAIAAGKVSYDRWCAGCHLADGTGRIGSNLTDDEVRYPRVQSPVGEFEIIYAGGSGAMQPFGDRISQDDILKLIAFLETLKK